MLTALSPVSAAGRLDTSPRGDALGVFSEERRPPRVVLPTMGEMLRDYIGGSGAVETQAEWWCDTHRASEPNVQVKV